MKTTKGMAVALAATILVSGGGISATVMTAAPAMAADSGELDAAINRILADTNAERAKAGLAPVRITPSMNGISQDWSATMASRKTMIHNPNYFNYLPGGWSNAGENVGQGYTPETIVQAWMNSESHRDNILGDYSHMGLGYVVDETGRGWFTQTFASYEVIGAPSPVATPTNIADKHSFTSNWVKPPEPVSEYIVSLYSADGIPLSTRTTTIPTITFTGLEDATTYTVRITARAIDAPGMEYFSPVTSYTVTTVEALPEVEAPSGIILDSGEDTINASWSAPQNYYGDFQAYQVDLLDAKGNAILTTQTYALNQSFTGLDANTNYTVKVTASTSLRGKVAAAAASASVQTKLSSKANVSEPLNLTLSTPTYTSIQADWEAPEVRQGTGLTYISTLRTNGKPDEVVETTSPSHKFENLRDNTNYQVTVQARIVSENGQNVVTTNGVTTEIKTPELVSDDVSVGPVSFQFVDTMPNEAWLSWTEPKTVVGKLKDYTVTVKQAGKPDRVIHTPDSYHTVTGLDENTKYTFEVVANAVSLNGKKNASSVSASKSVTTPYSPSTVIVSAPKNIVAKSPNSGRIDVSWAAPASVQGQVIGYEVVVKAGKTTVFTQTVNALNTSISGLEDGKTYTVEVRAIGLSWDETKKSQSEAVTAKVVLPATATPPVTPPTEPTKPPTKPTKPAEPTKPTKPVKPSTPPTKPTKPVGPAIPPLRFTEPVKPTVADRTPAAPEGSLSPETVKVSSPADVKFGAVTHNSVTATWKAPLDSVGTVKDYTVVLKSGGKVKKVFTTANTSVKFSGLNDDTAYVVEVRANAVSGNGKVKASSTPIVVETRTSKSPEVKVSEPEAAIYAIGYEGFTVSWKRPDVTGTIAGYKVIVKSGDKIVKEVAVETMNYSAAITGLKEDSSYDVTVEALAVAADGKTTASATSAATSVKTKLEATAAHTFGPSLSVSSTSDTITASWKQPKTIGSLVDYTVTIQQGNEIVKTFNTKETKVDFTELNADTRYTVFVKANAKSKDGSIQFSSTIMGKPTSTKK